jgi:hypothetical protein
MVSKTKNINDLAAEVLGTKVNDKFEELDLDPVWHEENVNEITVNDLARKYLSSQVDKAFSKADVRASEFRLRFEIKEFQMQIQGGGLVFLLILIVILSLMFGIDPIMVPLQALLTK